MGVSYSRSSMEIITKAINDTSNSIKNVAEGSYKQNILVKVENTHGNTTISGNNFRINADVISKNTFNALIDNNVKSKVDQQIEQITKALISGLNLGQASTSTANISNIIDNCITIKNAALNSCKQNINQSAEITLKDNYGDVNIMNNTIDLSLESIVQCIENSTAASALQSETDEKIKQITSSKAEGLDVKWVALIIVGIAAITGLGGITLLTSLLGPGLIAIGSGLLYYTYTENDKEKLVTTYIYPLNYLNNADVGIKKLIKSELAVNNDDGINHGLADVYELFNGQVRLYEGVDSYKLKNFKSEIVKNVLKIEKENNNVNFSILNSDKYEKVKILLNLPFNIKEVLEKQMGVKYTEANENDLLWEYNHNAQLLKFWTVKNNTETLIKTYNIPPTIVMYKEKPDTSFSNMLKNNKFLIGLGLTILGTIISMMQFSRKKDTSK